MRGRRSTIASLVAWLSFLLAACGAPGYGQSVDGLACDATGQEQIRARVTLHLVVDGVREPATTGVGSTGSCNYAVRTEGEAGVIVVRSNVPIEATLDTFLTIWEYAIPQGTGGASAFREAATSGEIRVNGEAVAGAQRTCPCEMATTSSSWPHSVSETR